MQQRSHRKETAFGTTAGAHTRACATLAQDGRIGSKIMAVRGEVVGIDGQRAALGSRDAQS